MAGEFIKIDAQTALFNKQLETVGRKFLPEQALKIQKLAALQVLTGVVKKNPVGNPTKWKGGRASAPAGYVGGRSRANWQVQFNSTNTDIIGGKKTKSGKIAQNAISKGRSAINGVSQAYQVIWIFNNVPYINALNRGHSKQAPAGWVNLTLLEVESGLGTL
jgi:hypothetical protein